MRQLVTSDRKRVANWVAEKIGCNPWPDDTAALGLEENGALVAGVVLDGYMAHGCGSLHCAGVGKHWLNRQFLLAVFDWCFNQLDLKVLLNRVSGANAASLRFTEHVGFSQLARFPKAWDGENDLVLFELRRENCRWIEGGR